MKQYRVFETESGSVEAVKVGWSWPGFLFTWIWACVKGLWLIGIIFIFIDVLLLLLEEEILIIIKSIVVCFLCGGLGNSWVEKRLNRKGNATSKLITAVEQDEAISKYNEWKREDGQNQKTESIIGADTGSDSQDGLG